MEVISAFSERANSRHQHRINLVKDNVMSDLTATHLLSEMQRMKTVAGSEVNIESNGEKSDFAEVFKSLLKDANSAQKQSSELANAFQVGDESVDLTDVMISSQKSRLAFQAVLQVRNKLVNAYQDIMNMPI
jgi:flagellar hook-basal body complex protein FliE